MTLLCCFVKLFKLIVNSFTKIKVSMEKTTLSIILIQRVIFRIVYTNVTSNSDVLNNAVKKIKDIIRKIISQHKNS